jgi:tetratricopeptide (TPR) repeat protein
MSIKHSIAVLSLMAIAGAWALPPEVEADRLQIQAKAAFDKKDYAKAADAYAQADKLGVDLPEKYYLQYASALSAQGKWSEAHDVLDAYLNKFSTSGKLYKEALAQYMLAEDKAKKQPATEHLVLNTAPPSKSTTPPSASVASASARTPAATGPKRVRPSFPFQLDDDVWRVIENSEAYRNAPEFKPLKVTSVTNQATDGEYLHSKQTMAATQTVQPLGAGYAAKQTTTKITTTVNNKTSEIKVDGSVYTLLGGLIWVATTQNGEVTQRMKRLDELRGSLFPLHLGAEMSWKFETQYLADEKFNMQGAYSCKVADKISATTLHPKLTGTAWTIHCEGSTVINGNKTTANYDEHYLEDLGVMRTAIGVFDLEHKTNVLPTPGYTYSLTTSGKYGSVSKYVVEQFDWSTAD